MSPITWFLIKILLVTILISIPAIVVIYNTSILINNPEYLILFALPSLLVLTRKKKQGPK